MDVEDIPFGSDFRDHIRNELLRSDLLLVIVGRGWLSKDDSGAARIQSETDPVRIEVETALQNSIPVIPVLVNGAQIPEPSDLPESLRNFVFLNAATVDAGRDFHVHMDRLIVGIDAVEAARRKTAAPAQRAVARPEATRLRVGGLSAVAAVSGAILLAGAAWWFLASPFGAMQHSMASVDEGAVVATGSVAAASRSGPSSAQPQPSNPAAQFAESASGLAAIGAIDGRRHLPRRSEGRLWRPASVRQSRDP